MLFFIGLGISGYNGISLLALSALKTCTIIYIERFTSAICDQDILELDKAVRSEDKGITMLSVQRWFVEDGREILERALDQNVALVTYGDPLIATTHTELYIRAVKNSINVNILHAASGVSSVIGETGLHMYKFGRSVTMMSTPLFICSICVLGPRPPYKTTTRKSVFAAKAFTFSSICMASSRVGEIISARALSPCAYFNFMIIGNT